MNKPKTKAIDDTSGTLTVSKLQKLDDATGEHVAPSALGKLENDLQMLHLKWQAVESEIRERDEEINSLQTRLDTSKSRCQKLESDLDDLGKEKKSLTAKLANRDDTASQSEERIRELEAKYKEISVHRQELEDYIDRRKADWDKLNEQVKEYENAIKGMSENLGAHEKIVAGKEEDKAALALKVMELERELATFKGRCSEQESGNVALQASLDEKSRELGQLNGEAIRLHKDVEKMQKKLERKEANVESLQRKLKERDRDSSTLETLLTDEKSTIAELQLKLTVANQRIEELTSDQQSRTVDLQAALAATEAAEEKARDANGDLEIRCAELQAELTELRADYKNAQEELEAQRELVQMLEREVDNSQNKIAAVDLDDSRITALGTGIRELDMQIDDIWLKKSRDESDPLQEIFEEADEELIPPEEIFDVGEPVPEHLIVIEDEDGGKETRFALNGKDITIGRAPNNDIRLRSKFISRVHAKIWVEGSTAVIEDVGSTNGFLVNSEQTQRHELRDGDKVEIGYRKLRYIHDT